LDVAEPAINPDTGYPVLSIGYPILRGDEFIGFAAANITVGTLSKYLDANKVSPNGKMLVIDQAGRIIAHPTRQRVCDRRMASWWSRQSPIWATR
jgi:adenylate cyclase